MGAMNFREMPIVTCRWEDARWVLELPNGQHEARDDREAVELVHQHASGAAIRWVLPVLAVELVTEPAVEP